MATSNSEVNLIDQLSQLTSRLSKKDDPGARKEALQLSKRLTASLEKPEDVAVSLAFSVSTPHSIFSTLLHTYILTSYQPIVPVTIRIAVYLELFKHIANHGAPISLTEFATLSGGEELLISMYSWSRDRLLERLMKFQSGS